MATIKILKSCSQLFSVARLTIQWLYRREQFGAMGILYTYIFPIQ